MSNEFKHASVGTILSQAEWEAVGTHVVDGQTANDLLYFDGAYWVRAQPSVVQALMKLDDFAAPDDNTDLDASSSRHGLLPKLSGSAKEVLLGTGAWGFPDIGARVYHSANQSIATATWTTLAFDSERWDTDGIHDNSTNNSRLTCVTAGKYLVVADIAFETNATGIRAADIILNGGSVHWAWNQVAAVSGVYTAFCLSTIKDLSAGDYLQCRVYQSSGSALNCQYVGNSSPEFMMQRIG